MSVGLHLAKKRPNTRLLLLLGLFLDLWLWLRLLEDLECDLSGSSGTEKSCFVLLPGVLHCVSIA